MLLVTWLVTLQPKFSRQSFQGYLLWLAISLIGGYAIYQGSIVLVAQWMGGHGFSSTILGKIFFKDFNWAMALYGVYGCVTIGRSPIKIFKPEIIQLIQCQYKLPSQH